MREEERKEIEKGEDGMKEANKEFAGQHRESKKLEKESPNNTAIKQKTAIYCENSIPAI